MRSTRAMIVTATFASALSLHAGIMRAQNTAAPAAAPPAGGPATPGQAPAPGRGRGAVPDPRVQNRTYVFKETGEELPWAVFVSSKIKKGEKAPMILALRGADGTPLTFLRSGAAVNLAEENGYILVGPMGYNSRGNYGNTPGRGRGAAPASPATTAPRPTPTIRGGTKETDPAKISEYSEKDVMNVFEMARKEFPIDENRIYLMGHSQGGGGALHIGEKYAQNWAAVVLLAPAVFSYEPSEASRLKNIPMMTMVGDADTLMTSNTAFAERVKALRFTHELKVFPGLDHSTIIMGSMPDVYPFFNAHTKNGRK